MIDYYSAIKKNEILPFVTTWMDIEGIILNEVSQTEKDKYCMFYLYAESEKQNQMNKHNKTETDSRIQRTNRWLPEGRMVGIREIAEGD